MRLTTIEKKAEFFFRFALSHDATDIHIIPKSQKTYVSFRISNRLIPRFTLSLEETDRLLTYLKFKANMDIGERRRPQNGSFTIKLDGKLIGLRISTLPSTFSESLVIRLLPQEELVSLQKLSLFPRTTNILLSLLKLSHGLIILTGPTGSGKTTTLYSLLRHCAKVYQRNVITLEDPVEKNNEDILQVQVNEKAGITYSTGLKAILRHDPDVIMVGEIRDGETAKIAIRAALTGHLVLTTMHTKDSLGALYRLLEFGVNWSEIEQTVVAVTAQRLVELVCPFCIGQACSPYCDYWKYKRSAVYEILHGKALQDALNTLKKGGTFHYRKIGDVIKKGIALGFIREDEYERWVDQFATEKLDN